MKKIYGYSLFVVLIASIGGFLFGYNTSVISGAILFLTQDMHLTILQQEIVVSTILIGALVGACIGGYLADTFGRKFTLLLTPLIYVIGIIFLFTAAGIHALIVGRFIVGFAVGITSVTVPLYIAEMSISKIRGMFVSFNQLAITIGMLVGYIVDYSLAGGGEWRFMFGVAFIPTILFFFGLLFIPETPTYLATKGKIEKAKNILSKIHRHELEEAIIETKMQKPKQLTSWKHLFQKKLFYPLVIGIGLSVFQQITGINIVLYYAPKIFEMTGLHSASSAILATVGIGIINVIMTIVALWLIDFIGRRFLLITSICGMIVCLSALSISFFYSSFDIGLVAVISLIIYVAFFAIGLGPVTWLIISEIFPMGIRGRAMGISVFFNWLFNYIVSLTFLSLIEAIGKFGTFILYDAIGIVALLFIIAYVPETKRKSLEEIQVFWRKKAGKS